MDAASLLDALRGDGAALAHAAEDHLDRPVAACPGWDVAQLVAHVGRVHRWAGAIVASGEQVRRRALPPPPEDPGQVLAWYQEGLAGLLATLESADPAATTWTFSVRGDQHVSWWLRRMALETAVHRWDAEVAATGAPTPLPPELGVEGVDELLAEMLPGMLAGAEGIRGTLHLHATDVAGEWWVDLDAEGAPWRREHAKADTAARGPASGLYLWLLNRLSPAEAGLEVFGGDELVDAWRTVRL